MAAQTSKDILRRASETLETAKAGLRDVNAIPERRLSGLRNLVVFGRAVTNVLENLRSTESSFDEWYRPISSQLAADPLMKFFYNLRTRILKKGDTGAGSYVHIKQLSFPTDMAKFGPKPQNARTFFIGDTLGGTGWDVEVAPGVIEKYYVEIPGDIGKAGLYFKDAPMLKDSKNVTDNDVAELGAMYIKRLQEIVHDAMTRFG